MTHKCPQFPDIDTDNLPPLQYAVLELLAARYRLGHSMWTMHTKLGATLRVLQQKGLVTYDYGVTPHTYQVSLTELGRKASMSESYVAPLKDGNQW